MKFYCFHFMPYLHAPLDFRERGHKSLWMIHPTDYFEPEKCRELYARYLDEFELVDRLGYDGISLNEHHQTPQSLMPAPNVVAGAISQRVRNGKILILGRALPLVGNPFAVAEEFSILDNITGGRLITGFVRGVGIEYHTAAVNPVDSLERYREAHEIILRAWTAREPFAYEGKHYRFPHLNLFPPPFQKPHPPIWVPSTGSKETIEWAAAPERKYTYLQFFNRDYAGVRTLLLQYRDAAKKFGYTAHEDQLGWATPVYVARTDEQAIREARPHMEAMFNDFMFMTPEMLFPPGYLTPEALSAVMAAKLGITGKSRSTIEDLVAQRRILVGSPGTVRGFIEKAYNEIQFGHLLPLLHFGTLPADLTRRNIELFAAEVMAPLREHLGAGQPQRMAVPA